MLISNVAFVNFTGYLNDATTTNQTAYLICSTRNPCYNIAFNNITLQPRKSADYVVGAKGSCQYTADDGIYGISGSGC